MNPVKTGGGVAITGMSVRFPDAGNQWEFWDNLYNGKDSLREVSPERRNLSGNPEWRDYIGEMADIDKFDYEFFNIPEDEAVFMDIRHRILLEAAYDALEDAGIEKDTGEPKNIGVYTGATVHPFVTLSMNFVDHNAIEKVHPMALLGLMNSAASSRISFRFNFTGPSMVIDTACSAFITSLAYAAEDIMSGKTDAAVVGSINCLETSVVHKLAKAAGILTQSKRVQAFGKDSDGSVLGEGAAVYVLEKLSDAVSNKKQVYGVIKGSAISSDGTSYSLAAPNPRGQLDVLNRAFKNADIDPARVSYIEAHGTGTIIGDPIEINTLAKFFSPARKQNPDLRVGIGSVKTNIGHLLPAAGSAGLTKILLAMKHKTIPASLHAEAANPALRIEKTPFYLVGKNEPWETKPGETRIAGISSFGLGGSNSHMIVEEFPCEPGPKPDFPADVLVMSAKTPEALERMESELKRFAESQAVTMHDIAYTRALYRRNYTYRKAETLDSAGTVIRSFQGFCEKSKTASLVVQPGTISETMLSKLSCAIAAVETEKADILVCVNGAKPNPGGFTGTVIDIAADGETSLFEALAELYVNGVDINWEALYPRGSGRMISLPGYPFARKPVSILPQFIQCNKPV